MPKKYFLSLILVISGFFLIIGVWVQAAEILYMPLNCTDGTTTYSCGYRATYEDIWVCGIKKILGVYHCDANATSIHTSECNTAEVWFKENACPNAVSFNGGSCILADPAADCWGNGIVDEKPGKWNAADKACVQCNGKERAKLLASTTQKCYNYTVAGCPFAGVAQWDETTSCSNTYATKCDYGCGASLECNHADDAVGVAVSGGVCNNCTFLGTPPLCPNGALDPGEQCDPGPPAQDAACPGQCQAGCTCPAPPPGNCESDCSCRCPTGPTGIPCPGGRCDGGLVPCGRTCDDWCTKNCECAPCTLCHLFVLFKRIVDFLVINIIFPLAALMFVVGGVMFLTAGGNPGRIGTAKKIVTAVVMGIVIILVAWLIVDTVITFITPAGSPFQSWHTIDCPVP